MDRTGNSVRTCRLFDPIQKQFDWGSLHLFHQYWTNDLNMRPFVTSLDKNPVYPTAICNLMNFYFYGVVRRIVIQDSRMILVLSVPIL